MTKSLVFLSVLLLCGGCALQPPQTQQPAPVSDRGTLDQRVDRLHAQARMLRYRGRHAEAIERLELALVLQPDNTQLREERQQSLASWQIRAQQLQDQLLISETRGAQTRIPLLETLARADPADTDLRRRLDQARNQLQLAKSGLPACGRRHFSLRPDLAEACLTLALRLHDDAETQQLLLRLQDSLATTPAAEAGKTGTPAEAPVPQAATQASHPQLLKAQQLTREGKYFGAIRKLSLLEQNGEADNNSRELLQQAQAALRQSTLAMLQAGDRMLQQGKPREALAIWEAVINMDPYNEAARGKIKLALQQIDRETDMRNRQP